MFVIDRYAYNNRWTDVPELNKFILFIILMVLPTHLISPSNTM